MSFGLKSKADNGFAPLTHLEINFEANSSSLLKGLKLDNFTLTLKQPWGIGGVTTTDLINYFRPNFLPIEGFFALLLRSMLHNTTLKLVQYH